MKSFLNRVLYPACLLFTVLCMVFSALLSWSDSEMLLPTISIGNLCQIFCFSLTVALANLLFSVKKIPYLAAFLLHYLCYIAGFGIIFLAVGKHYDEGQVFTLLLAFSGLYLLAAIPVIIIHFIREKRESKKSAAPYKRQFR